MYRVTGGIVAALLSLKKEGKTKIGLIEPFYTYHIKQIEQTIGTIPIYISSNSDFTPDFNRISICL